MTNPSISSTSVSSSAEQRQDSSTAEFNDDSLALIREMVRVADDRKAADMRVMNVADVSYLADYFIVMTGFSRTQIRAIARSVEDKVEEVFERQPERVEGLREGGWILLDYGDVILHIFLPQEREFYNIEAFWGHAETLDLHSLL